MLCGVFAAEPQTQTNANAAAVLLLAECVERLPSEPYEFTGDIVMRKAYGTELKRLKFKSVISWTPGASSAEYEIYSTTNALLETLRAERRGGVLTLTRTTGAKREEAQPPALNESVQGTDVTWLDIMMDFVWWKSPALDGTERVKGRDCAIVKVLPSAPLPGCAAMRLWLDIEQRVVMQATQVDTKGKETRRMWVRSVQKIDGQWLIKDIEVETPGTGHRTKIHIEDCKPVATDHR